MTALYIIGAIVLALAAGYLLTLRGRSGQPGMEELKKYVYTHRGLHGPGVPENSLAAFRAGVEKGYGTELDIHLLKDGSLAVIHDSSLLRVTGQEGTVEELTAQDLPRYKLGGTEEVIPLFSRVLEVYQGRTPLIIELKVHEGNYAALCQAACDAMEGYEGSWCMESFDPRCIRWLKKHRPQILRGQLSSNYFRDGSKLPWVLRLALTENLLNFLTKPDFIAYEYRDRRRLGNFLSRRLWGVQGVSWTLRSKEEYNTAVQEGWLPIFENFIP